jgi:predicted O-methyltransferase YrrM
MPAIEKTIDLPEALAAALGHAEIEAGIRRDEAKTMFALLRREHPEATAEIGCANGASTVVIASALECNGRGHHFAVDPLQSTTWDDAGKHFIAETGLSNRVTFHDCYPEEVFPALPKLDFVFIDGSHLFDFTILDFVLADKRLRPGGIIAFHDTWMPSIRKALQFVLANRAYQPLRLTSPPLSRAWSLITTGRRRLARSLARIIAGDGDIMPQAPSFKQLGLDRSNLVYIRKLRSDDRDWRKFADF